jgi:UV DNA damage repair endonuclease
MRWAGAEGLIVLHAGGVYDDIAASRERFIRRYEALPDLIRRRAALEHDEPPLSSIRGAGYPPRLRRPAGVR